MVTLTLLASALHELLKTSGSLQIQVLCNDINVATLCNKTLNTYLQYCTSKNGRCAFSECNNSVRKFIQYITEDIRIIKTYSKTIEDILDLLSTITPLLIRDELISISAQMSKASKNKIKHPDKKYVQLSDMIVSAVFEQNKQIN
jgi:hypothetical protein